MNKQTLYKVYKNVICVNCESRGAIQHYGDYYPKGVGVMADQHPVFSDVRSSPYMSHAMGFGGTIPLQCLNCDNIGLLNQSGLEGYKLAFESTTPRLHLIKKETDT